MTGLIGNCIKGGYRRARVLLWFAIIPLLFWVQNSAAERLEPPASHQYRVIRSFPHDRQAFTQGFTFADGVFFEGTGLYGHSALRKVDPTSGRILKEVRLGPDYFGEGITVFGERIVQVTWQSRVGFVYEKKSFRLLGKFTYPGEGWGITHDGKRIIMSDGTPRLRFLDPITFQETATLPVFDDHGPVSGINELEYIQGAIYANLWPTDLIAVIDPHTGKVTARIDLKGLLDKGDASGVDVLNGIAYDTRRDRLFVTGKWWPKVFEIRLIRKQ